MGESFFFRFQRMCDIFQKVRRTPTRNIPLESIQGPALVCSHLIDSVNNNENVSDSSDDAMLVLEDDADGYVVFHGVERLLYSRRNHCRFGVVQVVHGLRKGDLVRYYPLALLAAQVSSNATIPLSFVSYLNCAFGKEAAAFLKWVVLQKCVVSNLMRKSEVLTLKGGRGVESGWMDRIYPERTGERIGAPTEVTDYWESS